MDCSMPGFPVHHQLLELIQTHVYRVGDALQPFQTLSSPSLPTFNLSQHWVFSQGVRRNWATELNGTTFLHLDSCNTIYQTEQGSTKKSSILFKTTKQENNWVGTELSSDSKAVYSVISGLLNLDTITTWQPDNPLLSVCPTSYILECLAATWTYTNQLPVAISICGSQNFL